MRRPIAWILAFVIAFTTAQTNAQTDTQAPDLKTLNDHFPFVVPESPEAWQSRSSALRRRVLVATGLWPMPDKTAIKPVIHGRIERQGFTVDKVYFESLPGHFVTGMLFRPAADNPNGVINGQRPGVLCPHGHGGRTMRLDDRELARQIQSGGEVFEKSGRYPKLARCAHLARMGCVSFIFDMLGYADSQQIEFQTAHRHADPRPEESDRDQPCFFSIDADLNLQSIMGLQTWNAIRALDFLAELPDVDADRLGVTGGSGGGTQTILLGAIDPRIKVGFPNGMVSTSMQGGCYCENCNYLRIGTGNVELAALFAPKPQGMTAANDWTKDMLTDGYPQLKQLYTMLGVPEGVMCGDLLKYPHNYNYITRSMMYPLMAKHLGLPESTPLVEQDFEPFSEDQMKVWNNDHPAPTEVGIPHERKVLAWWTKQNDQKLRSLVPAASSSESATAKQLQEYRRVVGGAWKVIFDREMPKREDLIIEQINEAAIESDIASYRIKHPGWKTSVEVDIRTTGDPQPATRSIYPVLSAGSTDGSQQLLSSKKFASDKFQFVVPHLAPGIRGGDDQPNATGQQPLIEDKRNYSGFTFGYNRPLTVKRFEQLLCVLAFLKSNDSQSPISITAGPDTSLSTAAAAVVAGELVEKLAVTTNGNSFASVNSYKDEDFVPGAAKYFDLPGVLSLRAPHPLSVTGESDEAMDLVQRVYQAAGAPESLQLN